MCDYDIIIIGAGMTGCIIARELSYFNVNVAVVERSSYVCGGQSKANGAIIHGGHDPKPGTLKARLNVEGNSDFPHLCEELGVSFRRSGIYVVAFNERECRALEHLYERGVRNGVERLDVIDSQELRETEPNLSESVVAALSIPSGGIVDVHRLVIAIAEHAAVNGVDFLFETEVIDLLREGGRICGIVTPNGEYRSTLLVNCAGVHADSIMKMAGIEGFSIIPRKGEYYILDKAEGEIVSRPCFQVPKPGGKGILIFPTSNGNSVIGGDSLVTDDPDDTSTTETGFKKVVKSVKRLVPRINMNNIIASFAGIRAASSSGDFIIEKPDERDGMINVAGIASPGLSAAPTIARLVKNLIRREMKLSKSRDKTISYRIKPLFRDAGDLEKESLLRENSAYGRVVCRCENITEGDIVDSVHSPIPAKTIDAIKLRTKAGFGRCQGAFDLSRIIRILSRETGMEPVEIVKNEKASNIVYGYTKGNR